MTQAILDISPSTPAQSWGLEWSDAFYNGVGNIWVVGVFLVVIVLAIKLRKR